MSQHDTHQSPILVPSQIRMGLLYWTKNWLKDNSSSSTRSCWCGVKINRCRNPLCDNFSLQAINKRSHPRIQNQRQSSYSLKITHQKLTFTEPSISSCSVLLSGVELLFPSKKHHLCHAKGHNRATMQLVKFNRRNGDELVSIFNLILNAELL